jgi:hypothetical protein
MLLRVVGLGDRARFVCAGEFYYRYKMGKRFKWDAVSLPGGVQVPWEEADPIAELVKKVSNEDPEREILDVTLKMARVEGPSEDRKLSRVRKAAG